MELFVPFAVMSLATSPLIDRLSSLEFKAKRKDKIINGIPYPVDMSRAVDTSRSRLLRDDSYKGSAGCSWLLLAEILVHY